MRLGAKGLVPAGRACETTPLRFEHALEPEGEVGLSAVGESGLDQELEHHGLR